MVCKICGAHSTPVIEILVLNKYSVVYYQCNSCQFIQTEEPYWLNEAYSSAITSLDIGLPFRNLHWRPVVKAIIQCWFASEEDAFLDYGGGYGLFVRLMRDQGFNFYRQDIHCENLFAKYFDVVDTCRASYGLVTAFEVFEHLANPVHSVEHMLEYSDNILFSTELQPESNVTLGTWQYFIPSTGQHVSLYTKKSLNVLAENFNLQLYTDGHQLHMMTQKQVSKTMFRFFSNPLRSKLYNQIFSGKRKTLLNKDLDYVTERVSKVH